MDHRGTNLPAVGGYNQTVVLDAIRRRPEGITRSEIASSTALSVMTVNKVCRRLLDADLIDEHGMRTGGPGKPAAVVKLNPDGGFAVGVHIDPAAVTYVLVDLSGAVLDHSRTGTPTIGDPSAVIAEMATAIEALVARAAVDRSRVLGIGIASPGPVRVDDGVLLNPPMMPNWRRVALRRSLAEATGLPVLLDKDTTATVVAELWFARPGGRRDFAFMYYGTGLGTGLSLSGEVVRGISSNAGDAGHLTVDPDGPVCTCGRRGCVGYITVPRVLVARAVLDGVLGAAEVGNLDDMTDVDTAFSRLASLAADGHPGAGAILADAARSLARAIVMIVNLLDIDEVVFGGPFWARISSAILAALPDAVHGDPALLASHPIRFAQSAIPVDVAAVGAATLVLDNTFSPRPSALLLAAD